MVEQNKPYLFLFVMYNRLKYNNLGVKIIFTTYPNFAGILQDLERF